MSPLPAEALRKDLQRRLDKFQRALKRADLDAMLVHDPYNVFYLSGLKASLAFLLITPREAFLLVDGRYIETAQEAAPFCEVTQFKRLDRDLTSLMRKLGLRRIGFEGSVAHATVEHWRGLVGQAEWIESGSLIRKLRLIKSAYEIKALERSAKVNDQLYEKALDGLCNGLTEKDLAAKIYDGARRQAEGVSFDPIVSTGATSSRPHYEPAARPMENNQLLLIDMGVIVDHYCSDMTRVVYVGNRKPAARLRRMFDAVLEAEQAALAALGPGVPTSQLDRIARGVLKRYKMESRFSHGLGHGVGLEIHEAPRLSSMSDEVLRPGMVVTIEPGVYYPGVGGVRVEDLAVVTRNGYRLLSKAEREWRQIELS